MAVATMGSRILGLVREQVMAWLYGAGAVTDVFWVAYRIPNMLRDLFAEGSFSAAFVPSFAEKLSISKDKARHLLWSLAILLSMTTTAIVVLMMMFAREIFTLMAPKLAADAASLDMGVAMVRWMAPFLTVISLAALFMGALNSMKYFFVPALAPAFMNLVMIVTMLGGGLLSHWFGIGPALSLAIGVLLGGIVQALIQLPKLFKLDMGPHWKEIELWGPDTRKVISRLGLGTIGIAATQLNVMVSTILASGTVVGAVSWLSYAFRLYQFPVGILGVSLANSNLVHFSQAWKKGEFDEARQSLRSAFFFNLFFMLPAALLLTEIGGESVQLLFQRGKFSAQDSWQTANALRFYLLSLPFYGIYKIFSPIFYTIDRPGIPVAVSVTSVLGNMAFAIWATPRFGFSMLALSTTLSIAFNALCLGVMARHFLQLPWNTFFNFGLIKLLVAGLVSFFAMRATHGVTPTGDSLMELLMAITSVSVAGALGYLLPFMFFSERRMVFDIAQRTFKKFKKSK